MTCLPMLPQLDDKNTCIKIKQTCIKIKQTHFQERVSHRACDFTKIKWSSPHKLIFNIFIKLFRIIFLPNTSHCLLLSIYIYVIIVMLFLQKNYLHQEYLSQIQQIQIQQLLYKLFLIVHLTYDIFLKDTGHAKYFFTFKGCVRYIFASLFCMSK